MTDGTMLVESDSVAEQERSKADASAAETNGKKKLSGKKYDRELERLHVELV